ncbi:MAG: hypothetical protein J0M04_03235 [Verrucomicrobia bacterium]|nr:hypothetical protein [Verrucomicrobiota bacterium]
MANVFGILTAVLLALAAFVAFKNKDAYQNEVDHRRAEQGKLAASQERLKTAQNNLAATQKELSDTRAEVAKLKETEAAQKKTNDGLKEQIETKTAETATNKTKLDEIKAKIAEIGNIGEIVGKVKAMKDSVEDSNQQIAANTTKLANLTNENTRIEAFIEVLRSQEKMVSNKESYFKSAKISNIYPNWGFVTLSAGSTSGVVAGSNLEVVRDGQPIAKLLVSAVENNTASASIVPNSLAQDAVLMVGDKVVPTSKPVEPAKPAATPAAAPEAPAAVPEAPAAEAGKEAAPAGDKLDLGADPFAEPAKPAEKEN